MVEAVRGAQKGVAMRRFELTTGFVGVFPGFCCCFLWLAGCTPVSNVLIDSKIDGKVIIHTMRGSVLHTIERKQRDETRSTQYDEVLYSSALSPNQEELLLVVGYNMPIGSSLDLRPERYELVRVNLVDGTREILLESGADAPILSPQWSRSEDRVFVLRGNSALMLTREGNEIWSVMIPAAEIRRPTEDASGWGGYIRLSPDEKKLFIFARQYDMRKTNIVTLDCESRRVEWSSFGHVHFVYGKARAARFANIDASQRELVTALFGSPENPVFCPRVSPDGNYYFYRTKKEGFFSSNWIEGYSRQDGEVFTVLTYRRRLYAE